MSGRHWVFTVPSVGRKGAVLSYGQVLSNPRRALGRLASGLQRTIAPGHVLAIQFAGAVRSLAARFRQRRRTLLAILLAVAAAIGVWDEFFKYRFVRKRWGVVQPGVIYRSGQLSQWVVEDTLKQHEIRVVVDLCSFVPADVHQRREWQTTRRLGIRHVRFPLGGDGTGDLRMYAEAIRQLVECERSGTPVLVHCAAGARRTGGVVAAYRMLVEQHSGSWAYQELMDYERSNQEKLIGYLNSHMAELARMLVDMDIIDTVPHPLPRLGP